MIVPAPIRAGLHASAHERGIALVVVLLLSAVLGALAGVVLLAIGSEPALNRNRHDAVAVAHAAEAGLERAFAELAKVPDWSSVLDGSRPLAIEDGDPAAPRRLPDERTLHLLESTARLTCGRAGGCTAAQRRVSSTERPWAGRNPVWQLFLHGWSPAFALVQRPPVYIVVWVGDDITEEDGNPIVDGGGVPGGVGRGVVRVRAEAFGARGTRRALEATVSKRCQPAGTGETCDAGLHIHAWTLRYNSSS